MTSRSIRAVDAAVSSLKVVTDQIPILDALTSLLPKDQLLRKSIVRVYVEVIGQCCDCITVFRQNWTGALGSTFSVPGLLFKEATLKTMKALVELTSISQSSKTSHEFH